MVVNVVVPLHAFMEASKFINIPVISHSSPGRANAPLHVSEYRISVARAARFQSIPARRLGECDLNAGGIPERAQLTGSGPGKFDDLATHRDTQTITKRSRNLL